MNENKENTAVELRKRLKALRTAQNPLDMDRGGLLMRGRLYTWLATNVTRLRENGQPLPRNIAAFWSMPEEPQLRPLLRQWVEEDGYGVSLPVVASENAPLEFHVWTPSTPMREGRYGIQEPESFLAPLPDIVLVPTLGFTREGDRVGYGGGYYDRSLAALRATGHPFVTIGIAWACGDLSGTGYVPQPHDIRLDAVLTDKGWAVPAPIL